MNDVDDNQDRKVLPLWRWILRALSPGIGYLLITPLGFIDETWGMVVSMGGLFIMPVVTLVTLLVVSKMYYEDTPPPHVFPRFVFVLGFGLVNGFIIFNGCALPHLP